MPLTIHLEGGDLSFEQMMRLHHRIEELGADRCHWHYNDCGCCVTLHGPDECYVIGRDGGETLFPGRGCECEEVSE